MKQFTLILLAAVISLTSMSQTKPVNTWIATADSVTLVQIVNLQYVTKKLTPTQITLLKQAFATKGTVPLEKTSDQYHSAVNIYVKGTPVPKMILFNFDDKKVTVSSPDVTLTPFDWNGMKQVFTIVGVLKN